MARRRREIFIENNYYHIINRGNNKNKIFVNPGDKGYFQDKFFKYALQFYIHPIAFCIMNSHFHMLLYIQKHSNVPEFMRSLCTSYAMYYNNKYPHVGHVFQNRYKSKHIQTDVGVLNVLEYIRQNPVKAGFSDTPEDYAWLWVAGTDLTKDSPHITLPPEFPGEIS